MHALPTETVHAVYHMLPSAAVGALALTSRRMRECVPHELQPREIHARKYKHVLEQVRAIEHHSAYVSVTAWMTVKITQCEHDTIPLLHMSLIRARTDMPVSDRACRMRPAVSPYEFRVAYFSCAYCNCELWRIRFRPWHVRMRPKEALRPTLVNARPRTPCGELAVSEKLVHVGDAHTRVNELALLRVLSGGARDSMRAVDICGQTVRVLRENAARAGWRW